MTGVYSLGKKRRTIRVFLDKKVPFSALKKCIDAARLSPTARNSQPLEFVAVNSKEQLARMNEAVYFGGTVRQNGRKKGEEPKAFIAILANKEKSDSKYVGMDVGIAAQTIALTALEQGLGSCIQGAIERERIKGILGIPNGFEVPLVVALGFPKEKPVAVEAKKGNVDYWIENGVLHVPKRPLEEIMHRDRF